MVKVTIIVPVYNTEKYLDRCLNSISSQSYDNLEVDFNYNNSTSNSYFLQLYSVGNHIYSKLKWKIVYL